MSVSTCQSPSCVNNKPLERGDCHFGTFANVELAIGSSGRNVVSTPDQCPRLIRLFDRTHSVELERGSLVGDGDVFAFWCASRE